MAEIIRTIAVGIDGRVGRRLEDELSEGELVEQTNDFLDVIVSAFPDLAAVADGDLRPSDLRTRSLLGSTVMLRVLAGVYAELKDVQKLDDDDVIEFFQLLAPQMTLPVAPRGIWVLYVPDAVFTAGATAPRSRRQDLKMLRDSIVKWAIDRPMWLT